LLPHQTRTQQEIKDKLDTDLIRQQIEAETLDLHVCRSTFIFLLICDPILKFMSFTFLQSYSQYIISLMARLCAPGRDEKIRELTAMRDIVPLYKGIFEVCHSHLSYFICIIGNQRYFYFFQDFGVDAN
jgi:hypothetical protein